MQVGLGSMFRLRGGPPFVALVLIQGFHELEHITQVVQRYLLAIPNGNGLLGGIADLEPLHFFYNTLYLGLLVVTFLLLGLVRDGSRSYGSVVWGSLAFAVLFQTWHEVEHVFKLAQYLDFGVNGTGGVFGIGPGGLIPLVRVPLLHLAYNTVAYLPALIAFTALVRRAPLTAAEPEGKCVAGQGR